MTAVIPENRRAPEGMIWQCQACGKEAEDLYGMIGWRSFGWDESCMLNAAPFPASAIEAATADETRSGSAEGESAAPEGGDAQ